MIIMLGPGVFHFVEVEKLPESGDVLNLGSAILSRGRYRVERRGKDTWNTWGGKSYPYFTFKCVGEIPEGQMPLPQAVLNC